MRLYPYDEGHEMAQESCTVCGLLVCEDSCTGLDYPPAGVRPRWRKHQPPVYSVKDDFTDGDVWSENEITGIVFQSSVGQFSLLNTNERKPR